MLYPLHEAFLQLTKNKNKFSQEQKSKNNSININELDLYPKLHSQKEGFSKLQPRYHVNLSWKVVIQKSSIN